MARILVVDDHPDAREVVGEMLQMHGHTVEFSESVEHAWETIQVSAPDAVIVDHRLPGLPGTELLKRILQDPALAKIPVVICSGDDKERDSEDSAGAWGFWLKGSDDIFDGIARLTEHLRDGHSGC